MLEKVGQTNDPLERAGRAQQCAATLKLSLPAVVDGEDNRVNAAYAGWPDRFVVVGVDGRVAYYGKQGPAGFKPAEVEEWLKKHTKPPVRAVQSSRPEGQKLP